MKENYYVIAWKKKGKKRTKTHYSSKAFLFQRANDLAAYANQHFTKARHWPVPVTELKGV